MNFINELVEQLLLAEGHQEYLINGTQQMTIIRHDGSIQRQSSPFDDPNLMYRQIQSFGQYYRVRLDPVRPSGGGVVGDGPKWVRWHTILPPVSGTGPQLSLRQLVWNAVEMADFTSDEQFIHTLETLDVRHNIFFSGETGSGKTTLMTLLLENLSSHRRVFLMESLAEIPVLSKNWVRLTEQKSNLEGHGAFSLTDALRECLRMRPDQCVVGELRGDESQALFQLLGSMGQGIWTTIHAADAGTLLSRLSSISGIPPEAWHHLFLQVKPWYMQLQRQNPRLAGIFRYDQEGFRKL